ncbi:hypothetical protein Golax_020634, partial [Gossypium laxum]|nr:hypothetical protein [Gossypium laxum]
MDPYLDLDYRHVDPKIETQDQEQNNFGTNGVVPIQRNTIQAPMVVPDGGSTMTNISISCMKVTKTTNQTVQPSWTDREEKLVRYKEKRNSIKFEKTIHYVSRKAYAKVRLRIEGRFAKSSDAEVEVDGDNIFRF